MDEPRETLTFGSIFAGIGGIDLGLERGGWTCRWQVEIDAFCRHVLAHHWPDIPRHDDIRAIDWRNMEPVDLLAGGFPCQPVSAAGRQQAQADPRWLWPEFRRAIRELRPRLVLVENVRALLSVNRGTAFGDVLGDLAALGYDAEWDCISAEAVGAPHLRWRVWLVAYPNADSGRLQEQPELHGDEIHRSADRHPRGEHADRLHHTLADTAGLGRARPRQPIFASHSAADGARQAGEPLDGRLASQWGAEPDVGRVANGVPARVDRLRALGNAVVPQIPEFIGARLLEVMERAA